MSRHLGILLLAFLIACGSSAAKPARPAIVPLPAEPAAARAELALRFVRAIAARDRARMDALVDVHGFCEAGMKLGKATPFKSADHCADELGKSNPLMFDEYARGIPEGSEPGATEEYTIDADQGVYQLNVVVDGPVGLVGVFVVVLGGRPYLVFPTKKDE
jgi:hypothetical protein